MKNLHQTFKTLFIMAQLNVNNLEHQNFTNISLEDVPTKIHTFFNPEQYELLAVYQYQFDKSKYFVLLKSFISKRYYTYLTTFDVSSNHVSIAYKQNYDRLLKHDLCETMSFYISNKQNK